MPLLERAKYGAMAQETHKRAVAAMKEFMEAGGDLSEIQWEIKSALYALGDIAYWTTVAERHAPKLDYEKYPVKLQPGALVTYSLTYM